MYGKCKIVPVLCSVVCMSVWSISAYASAPADAQEIVEDVSEDLPSDGSPDETEEDVVSGVPSDVVDSLLFPDSENGEDTVEAPDGVTGDPVTEEPIVEEPAAEESIDYWFSSVSEIEEETPSFVAFGFMKGLVNEDGIFAYGLYNLLCAFYNLFLLYVYWNIAVFLIDSVRKIVLRFLEI